MFGKVSDRSRGPQWPSATRAESAIRRPRRSQTGLEQWIAESIALGYPERPAWRLRSGDLDRRVGGLTRRAGETPRFGEVSDRSRGPQRPSAARAESAIRRPRRSQTGLEQWIAENIASVIWKDRPVGFGRRPRPTGGNSAQRAGETSSARMGTP